MPRAAKEKSWATGVLLAALLAGLAGGASSAEASIPREMPRGVLLEQPVPLLEQSPLLEVPADEPVDMATTGGERLPLFGPGPASDGLFDGVRIPAVERFQAETRYRVIELEIQVRAELERLQTPERTGFALFGGGEPRRGSPNRYYDPELGRFISADPLGYVDGPSMYQYGLNSPQNFTDPLGLENFAMHENRIKRFDGRMEKETEILRIKMRLAQIRRLISLREAAVESLEATRGQHRESKLMGLATRLHDQDLVPGPAYDANAMAAGLLGALPCDKSREVVCHFEGLAEPLYSIEAPVYSSTMFILPSVQAPLSVRPWILMPGRGGAMVPLEEAAPLFVPRATARFIDSGGTIIDRVSIRTTVSAQRQGRHILGARQYRGGSYFSSLDDAQRVLDDFHSGAAEVLGVKGNDIVVRTPNVTGFNHNPGAGFPNQPTDIFFIKGSSSPSVVPYNPTWTP